MSKNKFKTAAVLTAAIFISVAAMTGCAGKKAEAEKSAEGTGATIFAVTTTTATKGELQDYLEFGGDVAAKTSVDILPDASGKIAEVKVQVGDFVEKNQVVALVDASRAGMNYEPSPVKSPISGTITAVNVVTGSMVSQQLSVARVSKMETLQITMNVSERYVSKIKMDQSAYLRFDAYPGEIFPARITEISPVLDQSSRSMTVKLSLVGRDSRIKAGMFARVKLITDTRTNTVKIPEAAVVTRFGETFVFSVRSADGKSTVKKQNVKPGIRVDDKIEILSGIAPGEEIVVRGQTLLEDESEINIVSRIEGIPVLETNK